MHGMRQPSVLRRAALAAHWVPDIGLLIRQDGRPTLRIATWPAPAGSSAVDLNPCEFRRLLLGAGPWDDDATLDVDVITGPAAGVGPFDLLRVDLENGFRVLAVPLDGDAEPIRAELQRRGRLATEPAARCDAVGVGFDHDVDLDATLAHVCFDPADVDVEAQAFEALLDIASAAAVSSLVGSLSAPPSARRPGPR
jgi:hypothetical protein